MDALNKQALRVLQAPRQHDRPSASSPPLGPEQEYFLIDKEFYDQRPDLILTGRTLFGATPPKGQELEDHYFGRIKDRVAAFMTTSTTELWKLGVSAKTQHNEVAPAQYELAPIFATTNIATDHNQLIMEIMQKVALRHGLVCLLHEKPFAGVNGSGKHNNWSHGHRRRHQPARTRATPRTRTRSSWSSCAPSSRPSTSTPTCCAPPPPARATTTAWAPTRRRRRSSRSSSATS